MSEGDVELEKLKDLDWDLVCQIEHVISTATIFGLFAGAAVQRCTRPAAWIATCRGCGTFSYLCDVDRQSPLRMLTCGTCGIQGAVRFNFTAIPPAGAR